MGIMGLVTHPEGFRNVGIAHEKSVQVPLCNKHGRKRPSRPRCCSSITNTVKHPAAGKVIARDLRVRAALAEDVATSSGDHAEVSQPSTSNGAQPHFQWEANWYPVALVRDLDPGRPTALRLLGERLVVWRDGAGQWRCFADRCPHRLVPLSEGRIESDGTLLCSYHGWRFNGEGKCTDIPQAADPRAAATATASPAPAPTSFPVKVGSDGLLWVWPQPGPAAAAAAEQVPLPGPDMSDVVYVADWFVRDVPFNADVLAENILDPSHVAFSHHGILGNRYKPRQYKFDPVQGNTTEEGFQAVQHVAASNTQKVRFNKSVLSWRPPCMARHQYESGMQMVTYAVPLERNRSRLFFAMSVPKEGAPWFFKLLSLRPTWLRFQDHLGQHKVLDGDNVFLHQQDRVLDQLGRKWKKDYYLPTSMDAAVGALRKWFSDLAPPLPWDAAGPQAPLPEVSRHDLLERFHSHTEKCPSCMQAFRWTTRLRNVAAAGALLALSATAGVLAQGVRSMTPRLCVPLGLGLVLLALAAGLQRLRQSFIFVDYVHPEHD